MENTIQLGNLPGRDYNYEEALKTLRTNLLFSGNNTKIIMVGSALENEGKTEISYSLAYSLTQIGKKVLFLDADIRKSVVASRFQLDKEVNGLSEYLSGQKTKNEIVYETNVENLSIVFAGPYSPNPAELLEESQFSLLIQSAREEYDYVIIDTPPMGNLIDAVIIAPHCDGAVLVIESGKVSYHMEQRVKKQLEKSGCRILGAILNKVNSKKNQYYNQYYKKYKKYMARQES